MFRITSVGLKMGCFDLNNLGDSAMRATPLVQELRTLVPGSYSQFRSCTRAPELVLAALHLFEQSARASPGIYPPMIEFCPLPVFAAPGSQRSAPHLQRV
jgi:hypothetical protein